MRLYNLFPLLAGPELAAPRDAGGGDGFQKLGRSGRVMVSNG